MHKMPKIKRSVELREVMMITRGITECYQSLNESINKSFKENQKKVQWLLYRKYRYKVLLKQLID